MRVGTPGFVAARLTEAREARGLAQTALAELTGIKSQSISHYEQGRQSPSPDALLLLCEKLELPQRYFLKPTPVNSACGIFFHSYRPAARTARMKTERRLSWLKEIAWYLRCHIDLPAAALPEFPVSSGLADCGASEIETIADTCRVCFGLGYGPLPDMVGLLERLGCVVSQGAFRSPPGEEAAEQAAEEADEESDSVCSQWDAGVPYILLSRSACSALTRFDAAHELGHMIMHRGMEPDPADHETHRMLEQQADHFARAFLLPARVFGREVWAPTVDALLSLKKQWDCPVSAMILRCGEIGVFDAEQVRKALANLARRGSKSGEPAVYDLETESPRLLARGIRLLIEAGVKDRHELLTDLSLSAADIEDLVGLPRNYFAERTIQTPPPLRLRSEYVTPGAPA